MESPRPGVGASLSFTDFLLPSTTTTRPTLNTIKMFSFGQTPNAQAQPQQGGFNFGATPTATTAAASGFSFGATAPTAQSTAPATSLNTGFSGFGVASPAASSAAPTVAAPAAAGGLGGFNFGGAATSKPAAPAGFSFGIGQPAAQTSQAPAASGFNFGGAATQTAATAAPTTVASTATTSVAGLAAGGSSGGFFGIKAPGTAATSSGPSLGGFSGFGTSTSATSGGSVLGGLLTAPATAAKAAATITAPPAYSLGGTAATATTAPATGFALGSTAAVPKSSAPTLTGGLGLGGFGSSAGQTAASTSTTTATASTAAAPPTLGSGTQKQMTFRQLEDTINKWTTELEDQERYFLDQATQVNAWDRIVMDNGEKIIQLNKDVEKVKLDQQKLDHELDFVRSQQKELDELLDPLEKALDNLPPISHQQHAHLEREHTYMLAESLDSQLKRMGQDLKEILERLNSNASKPDSSDPVQQITKILNAHVVSLMWVDRNSDDLQSRVEDIARLMESEKREQERNFRLAYS